MSTAPVKVTTSDDKEFPIKREVALMSVTIKNMLEDIGETDAAIPLPNVSSKILPKVIEYCEHHLAHPEDDIKDPRRRLEIVPWDLEFTKVDQETLFGIMLAANYLDIKPLLELTCKVVARMIQACKSAEELMETFHIENPFSPEEFEELKKAEWIEEEKS